MRSVCVVLIVWGEGSAVRCVRAALVGVSEEVLNVWEGNGRVVSVGVERVEDVQRRTHRQAMMLVGVDGTVWKERCVQRHVESGTVELLLGRRDVREEDMLDPGSTGVGSVDVGRWWRPGIRATVEEERRMGLCAVQRVRPGTVGRQLEPERVLEECMPVQRSAGVVRVDVQLGMSSSTTP